MFFICLDELKFKTPDYLTHLKAVSPRVQWVEERLLFVQSCIYQISFENFKNKTLKVISELSQQPINIVEHKYVIGYGKTPYEAQARAQFPDLEWEQLPLEAILHLEGLKTWGSDRIQIDQIVRIFKEQKIENFNDLMKIHPFSWRYLFGNLGDKIYQRIHKIEVQKIISTDYLS